MNWHDATLPMRSETVHWPGHPHYTVDEMMSMAQGENMNVTAVSMCSHFGTHIDAPRHYYAEGKAVDELPPEIFIGPGRLVVYEGEQHIPVEFIRELDLNRITRLFIRTSNSEKLAQPEFFENYLALTSAAAQALVNKGIVLLGVDGYSIGPFDPSPGMPVHRIFLGGGPDQVAIEEVNLAGISAGDYQVLAIPLRLTGLEASPARVLLGY